MLVIQQEWRHFLIAMQFFTRIPIDIVDFESQALNKSSTFFPLVGMLVGCFAALVFTLANSVLSLPLAVIISMVSSILLTGAFHEDGLADMADGFGGGWEKAQVLSIMVDSRLGSYGAIGLMMTILAKYQSLVTLSNSMIAISLIVGHALSRWFAVATMMIFPYVKFDGKSKPIATKLTHTRFIIASVFGLCPLLFLPIYYWASLSLTVMVWLVLLKLMRRKIGGYTGDCLGAVQQLTEVTFYIGLVASFELYLRFSI